MSDLIASHAPLWARIQTLLNKEKLPQALLLVGPPHAQVLSFTNRLIAILLCHSETKPCGHCSACHLLKQGGHPDVNYLRQESPSSAIKIEQIRELQQDVYQTPQRGKYRITVIDPADRMNIFAANALLKILEEPPAHTLFILIAEQVSSIPATILSRCQKYMVPASEPVDYLSLGCFYPDDSPRSELFKQSTGIITALCELLEEKISLCTLAAQWTSYVFDDLLWLLYLVTAQAINYQLLPEPQTSANQPLQYLARSVSAINLFKQLEQMNRIMRNINNNINFNQTLVLENLLLGYLGKL